MQAEGRWDEAGRYLAEKARSLEGAGADLVLLCTNTMHLVAAQIQDAIDIPLLHIIDVTADAARQAGLSTLGLLATRFTMEQPFYRDRMRRAAWKFSYRTFPAGSLCTGSSTKNCAAGS